MNTQQNQQLNWSMESRQRLRYERDSQLIQVVRHSNCWIKPTKSQDFSWRFLLRRGSHHKTSLKFQKFKMFKHAASKSLCLPEHFPQPFFPGSPVPCSPYSAEILAPEPEIHCSQHQTLWGQMLIHVDDLWFFWPSWQTMKPPFFARKTATLAIPFRASCTDAKKNTSSDASSNCDWSSSFWVFNLAMSLSFLRAAKRRLFVALRMLIDNNTILLSWYYIHVT